MWSPKVILCWLSECSVAVLRGLRRGLVTTSTAVILAVRGAVAGLRDDVAELAIVRNDTP